MLYKKNNEVRLNKQLFEQPTSEYRGAPFWAWNCKLDKAELLRQIDILEEMGFGGFHMHVRYGMDTPYLSDRFMNLVKDCVDKAAEKKMLAWLYDEDRWPSGFAGGLVTKNPEYRARYLLFTVSPFEQDASAYNTASIRNKGSGTLVNRFDIELDENNKLKAYRPLSKNDKPKGSVWYAYVCSPEPSVRYNGQTYVNTLDKKSIDRFIEITYEAYKAWVGNDFDGTVPAIFTDEPQFTVKSSFKFADSKADVTIPWTDDLNDTYRKSYNGEDLVAHIPELFWELPDGRASVVRYHYHDHVCERFVEAYADNCGKWCDENNILFTGHMMREPSLTSQSGSLGEAMRCYRSFHIPGIDILSNSYQLTTAKQAQSATHQYGREGMMSELYGVTGWDYDFRGHKLQGDWQAALGVTVRVPHLSWVSMQGEAKRDYPASISYQSPWYKNYSYIENHFSRLNTALTRGTPVVKVGVIHPIESFWLHFGPSDQTAMIRDTLDTNFSNITSWLLYGCIDFDFISESLIPELTEAAKTPLHIGHMAYDAIIVPECETLRSTTLDMLEKFASYGGKLIFMGKAPTLENAVPSTRGRELYDKCEQVSFTRGGILTALEKYRSLDIRLPSGELTSDLLYQLRRDNDCLWLFICNGKMSNNCDLANKKNIRITLNGVYKVKLYDTLTGKINEAEAVHKSGKTIISTSIYEHDSLLYNLSACEEDYSFAAPLCNDKMIKCITANSLVNYSLHEPNALLLDMAQYAFDDDELDGASPLEELLTIDTKIRRSLNWTPWSGDANQPWCIKEETITHRIRIRFTFESEIIVKSPLLALETPENAKVTMNGEPVKSDVVGWYVDKSIKTIALPDISKGTNIIEIEYPFGKRTTLEWCYILGNFGVKVLGINKTIVKLPKKISHDDITRQYLPFYSGILTYSYKLTTEDCELHVTVPRYRGADITASLDGKAPEQLPFAPYTANLGHCKSGTHKIDISLYISRTNGFGPLHNTNIKNEYLGPRSWRTTDTKWSDEYNLTCEGILTAPKFKQYITEA